MGGETAGVPGLARKVMPIQSVSSGAGGATCCESLKQLSEIETDTKLQAMQPHCCNDSISRKPHFHFCFTEGKNTFTGNTITTRRWWSCRGHPGAFCLQKAAAQCSLQRQSNQRCLHPLKQHGYWKQNFQVQGALPASNFKKMLSIHCHELGCILLETIRIPQKCNPAFSLLLDFNKKHKVFSGGRQSWPIVLPFQWCFMLCGSHIQVSFSHHSSASWRLPRRRRQCGGTAASRSLPAWAFHHTSSFPFLFFSQWLTKKWTCKYRNHCPHCCSLQHSF